MEYVTLLVVMTALTATAFLLIAVLKWIAELRRARREFRSTVEGLSVRTHRAAQMDQERARDSREVAEASRQLTRQAEEVQDTLALERKLRKALTATASALPEPQPRRREKASDHGASA